MEKQSHGLLVNKAKTLSIMPTYTCTAACTDCASLSSPKIRDQLPLSVMLDAIHQAKSLGFYNVVFTGGEATLRWRDLLQCIRQAKALKFPTRLVTNAHWATTPTESAHRIAELISAGLDEINYSTGDEHARFVPLERIALACVAAVEADLPTWVMIETRQTRGIDAEVVRALPQLQLLTAAQRQRIHFVESPWMPLDPGSIESYPPGMAADQLSYKAHTPCDNILQTFTLQANGQIGACCGIGMRLIPELNVTTVDTPRFLEVATREAEEDFVKLWIHYKGPEQILAWAAQHNPDIQWEGLYAHRCQACARLYRDPVVRAVIREHYAEMMVEVLQSAWFDEHYASTQLNARETVACAAVV